MVEQDDKRFQNPGTLADDLAHASKRVRARREIGHAELYHRMSATIRVTDRRDGGAVNVRSGCDEGIALRLWDARDSRVRFASASGRTVESIERAVERAIGLGGKGSEVPAERHAPGKLVTDHDQDTTLPDPDRLATWLAAARDSFAMARGAGGDPHRSWVEVASTTETWVVDDILLGSRRRARGWALVEPAAVAGPSPAPLIVARRRWKDLDPQDWVLTRPGTLGIERPVEIQAGRHPVLLSPEAAATLVLTLVRWAARDRSTVEVGPGFRVRNAPEESAALFGGVFDDLGFPTTTGRVADGRTLLDRLEGPGHYRRASFRDAPVCLPANLVVEPPETVPPRTGLIADRASVHPLSPERWVLELGGTWWTGGEPGGSVRATTVPTSPRELLLRCVGGVGAPLASYRGVLTPALLFDGLLFTA